MIDERDATVDVESLPTVTGDHDQLGQVVQNLVKNALEHAGDEPPTVRISVAETDGAYRFAVADDGVGIPESRQETIFDIFQSDAATRDGTGIGLAVCERIVTRHGGDIWVESTPGTGATFYFTLPSSDQVSPGGVYNDD
ncbi:HAMP domain-containing sensor histidine kinase [Haloarculaceae archaeon H-GB2-1]|nr:HAMP domain-containing sensor histidine kinase [Haloarculaceae archaeon H-GB2-1]